MILTMKNKYCPQLDSIIESATRKIYGYGVKSVKRGSTSQTDSKLRLEQKQVIVDAVSAALNRQREDMEKELADKLEGELSFSKGQGWRGEEAFKMIERDLERIIQTLKGRDKLEVDKEV